MGVGKHKVRTTCGLCAREGLTKVLDLGMTPLANEYPTEIDVAYLKSYNEEQEIFPLALVRCEFCKHVQTSVVVDQRHLFKHYLYATGTSPVTVQHFAKYAKDVVARFDILDRPNRGFVVEIGSNDGTMLKAFKDLGVGKVLGVDPAENIAKDAAVETIVGFFSADMGEKIAEAHGTADLVIANNVLAHAEDILGILKGVKVLLDERGVFVFEVSYLMDMFEHMAFDTIYHEHFAYHTLSPLMDRLNALGMAIIDVQRNPEQVGRGSIRITVSNGVGWTYEKSNRINTDFSRRFTSLVTEENVVHESFLPWDLLKRNIVAEGNVLRNRIYGFRGQGKVVCGYGAPAKLTTLTYAMNLPPVDYVIDDAPLKIGRLTPGQHIPIVASTGIAKAPDVCIIYAWNFADSIIAKWREGNVTDDKGQPLPTPLFVHPISSMWP
jgi:C-methyltransferase-like protein/methyltransferase family protein/putative zinc binding protein